MDSPCLRKSGPLLNEEFGELSTIEIRRANVLMAYKWDWPQIFKREPLSGQIHFEAGDIYPACSPCNESQ